MNDLKTQIREVLLAYPGLSAREIARHLRGNGADVSKKDLNPLLYRDDLFENDGGRVPLWRLAALGTSDDTFNLARRGAVARARRERLDHQRQIVTDAKVGSVDELNEDDLQAALLLIQESGLSGSPEMARARHASASEVDSSWRASKSRDRPSRPRHAKATEDSATEASISRSVRASTPPFDVPEHDWFLGLHQWQREALHLWLASGQVGVCEAVTGTGKTHLGLEAVAQCVVRGERATILVPTILLQQQWAARIAEHLRGVSIGTLGGGPPKHVNTADVVIAVVHSAAKTDLTADDGRMTLMVADEVHRYGADGWAKALRPGYTQRLGLTATLERGGDEGVETILLPYFERIVHKYGYDRATREDVVAPFDLIFLGARMNFDEANEYEELSRRITKARAALLEAGARHDTMNRQLPALHALGGDVAVAVELYEAATRQRRRLLADLTAKREALGSLYEVIGESDGSVIFTQSKETAIDSASRLTAQGLKASAVYSEGVSTATRQELLDLLRDKQIDALAAPRILDEGIDIPNVDLGIVIGASSSRRQMIQRLGRIIRRKPDGRGARFVVLYAVGSVEDPQQGGRDDFMQEVEAAATQIYAFADWNEGTIDDIWAQEAESWQRSCVETS